MAMPETVTVSAPAKLNLALSVGRPDENGMHPVCSWMVTVNLFDELEVKRLEADYFSRYAVIWHAEAKRRSEINWPITSDLAVRAHLALEDRVRRRLPLQMKLEKRIPVGGGLGGGSSNAAAMLIAVNELFELGLSVEELAEIGEGLGADVPFLVCGGSAIVEGLGERLQHHDECPDLHAVLVFPDALCPTGEVYSAFDQIESGGLQADAVRRLPDSPLQAETLFNDLKDAAIRVTPTLKRELQRVSELAERPVCVSGSGSSIFIVCDEPLHAEALAAAIESKLDLPAVAVKAVGAKGGQIS
ncbi:MAG: 4-(cytidine 5'-diphospho)-2-C-methyl-D-erythritol kinase [Phycisphaerales bacterium]|nr:MAG: 4-(cytidine 5'-diphospho)-2-C-methyl-D-erythritol kinase [Phycisphaerales bacterium]